MKTSIDKTTKTEAGKVCFSYIRFSTKIQSKGSSESRQLEIAPRIAKERGWILDETLNAQDLGLSAYKKFNLRDGGGLRSVIEAAKTGRLPVGVVMIVEALDRLFRVPVDDAYQIFREILKCGVEVFTNNNQRHLTIADLNNPMSIMMTISELYSANQYSAILSERVGKAWAKKRQALADGGKRLTKKVPSWIDPETFEPIPEKVKTVNKVFSMYEAGYGVNSITRQFNSGNVPPLNKAHWSPGFVSFLLHNRAVIGEFQPSVVKVADTGNYSKQTKVGEVIPNYYKPIVDRNKFLRVQAKLGEHKTVKKTDRIVNMFAGVARCRCGARMFVSQGKKKSYLACYNHSKGLPCDYHSVRYDIAEAHFKSYLDQNEHLLAHNTDDSNETELQNLRARLVDAEKRVKNITEALEMVVTKANVLRQSELEAEIETIKSEMETKTAKTSNGNKDEEQLAAIREGLENLTTDMKTRRALRDWIIANIKSIEFGYSVKIGSESFESYLVTGKNGYRMQGVMTPKPIWCVAMLRIYDELPPTVLEPLTAEQMATLKAIEEQRTK